MKRIKRVLSLAVVLTLVSATLINADYIPAKSSFTDVVGHWVESKLQEGVSKEIIVNCVVFRPDDAITRFEFAEMMNQALNQEAVSDKVFTDLEKGSVKEKEMLKAVANGYIVGYEDNTIKPDNNLLRQEAAAMVATAIKLADNQEVGKKFTDYTVIEDYAKAKVGAVSLAGIMGGNPDGSFDPQGKLTRAEGLVIVLNVALKTTEDLVIDKDGTVLENQIVKGNLVISEALGNGSATLNNVTVLGKTIINGGGKNSIHINDSIIDELVVNDAQNIVRVIFTGTTNVEKVTMDSGGNLDSANHTGTIANVHVTDKLAAKTDVALNVPVTNLHVSGDSKATVAVNKNVETINIVKGISDTPALITISKDATVTNVVADHALDVKGEGKIENLEAKVDGIVTEIKPDNTETTEGVTPPVVTPPTPPASGGGGGGGTTTPSYDTTVTEGLMHIEGKGDVKGTVANGVMTFDLSNTEGIITGITLVSDTKNTYTVATVKSPNQEDKTGSWICETKELQSMKKFIDIAKKEFGYGGNTNADKMPISVIRNFQGSGNYTTNGTINGKTLVINITL